MLKLLSLLQVNFRDLITLLNRKRGVQVKMDYITPERVLLEYDVPLNEIVMDFMIN